MRISASGITPVPRYARSAQPRFGADIVSLANALISGVSSSADLGKKKGSVLRDFILYQLIPMGILGTGIANVDRVVQLSEWGNNVYHGRPLETVLAKKFPVQVAPGTVVPVNNSPNTQRTEITETRAKEMIQMVRHWRTILSPQFLNDAAELGLIQEVQVLPYALGKPQWKAVFIDGTERLAYEDTVLREKLLNQLNIPVRNQFNGWSHDLFPSFTAAALIISALGVLMRRETFIPPNLTEAERRRLHIVQAGPKLVAAHQGVTEEPITKEEVEEQLLWARQKQPFKALDLETLMKRLRVSLSSPLMERRFYKENPSVGGSSQLEAANDLLRFLYKTLGVHTELGVNYTFPATMTEGDKAKLEAAVFKDIGTMTTETQAIIDTYDDEAVENLLKGLDVLENLTQDEVKALLAGKAVADVKADRSYLGRLWRKINPFPSQSTPPVP